MKKALLFGASGFVGSFLLRELLDDPAYGRVTIVVRKDPGLEHPKLRTLTGGPATLDSLRDGLEADEVFISIGTTKKKTPDLAEYYAIDHDYPVAAAKMAREQGAASVFLVSAMSADADSSVFYNRTKGETDRDVTALGFEHTHIFRPGVIMGERPENRPLEKALIAACTLLNPLLAGSLKRYRGMEAKDIARAIHNAAQRPAEKVRIYYWEDMQALL